MLLIPAEDEDLEMIRSTEDIRLLKLHLLRLIKVISHLQFTSIKLGYKQYNMCQFEVAREIKKTLLLAMMLM